MRHISNGKYEVQVSCDTTIKIFYHMYVCMLYDYLQKTRFQYLVYLITDSCSFLINPHGSVYVLNHELSHLVNN